ncbi:MAG: hypothetical protein ACRDLF_16190, partial [Solirubrobacteraceae bacterium]
AHARPHGGAHAPLRHSAHAPSGTSASQAHARTAPPAHAPTGTALATNGTSKRKVKSKPKGPSKNRLSDQQKAELTVEEAEAALRAVEDALADPAAWATKYESAKSEARHTAARRAVEAAYERLEALVE